LIGIGSSDNEEAAVYKNLLIATDGSALAQKAVEHGIALAKALGAKITALVVTEPFDGLVVDPELVLDTPAAYATHARQFAAKTLAAVEQAAKAAGVACHAVHAEHEHPYEVIISTAKAQGCDLIVMASHGRRGVAAVVLGSQTVKLLTHSTIPVLVCR
jgi:nucleotide-binding universal stress UspA family protein